MLHNVPGRFVPAQRFLFIFLLLLSLKSFAQPANDNCANASVVNISGAGFGIGVFASTTDDITNATLQTGETFAPAILVAGQSQKSMWYKFTLPTQRSVKVTLAQTGTAITAGDVGFAVYKTNGCLPGNAQISTKLTPIGLFGNTFHPCVDSAVYYVQVSAKNSAAGQVYITVETSFGTALYDRPAQAYNFGTLTVGVKAINYAVDCHSIEDAAETCPVLSNSTQYNKSTWHVFKTPAYFDYITFFLAHQTNITSGQKFGFKLYQGDVTLASYSTLPVVAGCDSLQNFNIYYAAIKTFKCGDLNTNTTYSIQLFFKQDFNDNISVALNTLGTTPTIGHEPMLTTIPAPTNALGVLPSNANGVTTTISDYHACNSRHSQHNCPLSMPVAGVTNSINTYKYNLSSFFTFSLSSTSEVSIYGASSNSWGQELWFRLYKQGVTNNCTDLDPVNIVGLYRGNVQSVVKCLDAGNYTLQVLGTDTVVTYGYSYGSFNNTPNPISLLSNLGLKFNASIFVKNLPTTSKYALQTVGAFDTLNLVGGVMQPLVNGVQYNSHIDTFGCAKTVLPWDTACAPGNTKAVYREFVVNDSTLLTVTVGYNHLWKLYQGDANALANSQNVHTFPQKILGLTPYTKCLSEQYYCGGTKVCLQPGTYTHVTFGADGNISQTNQPGFKVDQLVTAYASPANAENLGDILALVPPGTSMNSSVDYFSCKNNAVAINGFQPCIVPNFNIQATKAIYRQFYLSQPASINIGNSYGANCPEYFYYSGVFTLFSGKATDGLNTLTAMPAPWQCTKSVNTNSNCNILPAGWYTVVSYGVGPSYSNPASITSSFNSGQVGMPDRITIGVNAMCAGPKYNRPYKAAIDTITQQPFLIQWGPRVGHTAAYPKTDTTYTLYKENFNCTVDTPFTLHPIPNCNASLTKVAYYVFKTTQESYVQIDTKNFWGAVYAGNARTDSASFPSSTPIQTCMQSSGKIQLCRLQPGTYTLVIFGLSTDNCTNVQPTIYIDRTGYSRFDHANTAYDFGLIPPDSLYHNGKVGDVNPLDASRAPSNDFFYCTTGSQLNDPDFPPCGVDYVPAIYNPGNNNQLYNSTTGAGFPRRNLWYTFVVDKGGYVKVKVDNKTIGKNYQYYFSVYKSNVNGNLPFSTVVNAGQVDSTLLQGLTFVGRNYNSGYYCYAGPSEISFYIPTCNPVAERYYIIVDNPTTYYGQVPYYYMNPDHQAEVSILMDSVNTIQPQFDHYYQANNIGTNLGAGTYTGATDNFSCATKDLTEPFNSNYGNFTNCTKTLWYKFSTTVTGKIRYRVKINNGYQNGSGLDQMQLFKQMVAGDSTSAGLMFMNYTSNVYDPVANANWYQTCINPGTYYFILPGCNRVAENAFPEIQIVEDKGDFCTAPVIATLNGAGSNVSSVTVDCHTIGTDYGEFNATLTCPNGAPRNNYKTSWFKINITGTDTLDVTTYLSESTTVLPSQIKYRMMDGNCGAMQERSCVQDAQTQDTYKCLPPGEYFIQVFTPIAATGTINLHLSAVHHVDTCAPINNCLATSVFLPQFDCTVNDTARFTNLSTYGSGIQYEWDFGYNNQTSNAVSPTFVYPFLATNQTYTVKLKVTNYGCVVGADNVDTSSQQITIPGRPYVNLGNDTTICASNSSLLLNATSWAGSTYLWNGGITTPTKTITNQNVYTEIVRVTYNGCIKRDTIVTALSPFTRILQTKVLCGNDSVWLNADRQFGNAVSYLWNTGFTGTNFYASNPNQYINTLTWRGCAYKDTFNVINAPTPFVNNDTTLCYPFQSFTLNGTVPQATSYSWQNGAGGTTFNVTAPGNYWIKYYYLNCYKTDTIKVLSTAAPVINTTAATVCSGQSYTLPWGPLVNATGIYSDTLNYPSGCDSLIRKVNLTVTAALANNVTASICAGQSYTLPWGGSVTNAGIYKDTIQTMFGGCDSLIQTVNLSINTVTNTNNSINLCAGQSYTLPWGGVVNTTGVYKDTLQYVNGGCDSLIKTVNVTVQTTASSTVVATICSGQNYTAPWGTILSATGIYADTLRYLTGCDSSIRNVNLTVTAALTNNATASICAGQSFTLPWGGIVNSAGIYKDTIQTLAGCDSLIQSVNLSINTVTNSATNINLCAGQSYTLPWGGVVTSSGTYSDTIPQVIGGCDSLITTVNVNVQATIINNSDVTICSGQTYTSPWGAILNSTGTYADTLHYFTGCDSLIRTVNLIVNAPASLTTNASICTGSSYVLPWGTTVSSPGVYKDTLHYLSGCDSLRRTVNITVNTVSAQNTSASICGGQTYLLPWGQTANTTGIYKDTLHYLAGCDSVIRSVSLTVYNASSTAANATICAGQSYTLPWGTVVNTSGIYKDTLHYFNGCDSLIRTINLAVNAPTSLSSSVSICAGQSYTLPWGVSVNQTGIYKDTLHYVSGCDSIINTVNLLVKPVNTSNNSVTICSNQSYTLPWGQTVNTSGIYRDTLDYASGCDSLIRIVNLTVKPTSTNAINAAICSGNSYVLPWGASVNTSGTYKDTLYYLNGCDSVIRVVNLVVNALAVTTTKDTAICAGESYTLPWGTVANTSGLYIDTTKSLTGCDSLIRRVTLTVNPKPVVSLTKSNDVNCMLGTANLNANGGYRYLWSPAGSLNNATIKNPVASPAATTTYVVQAISQQGCVTKDSIRVIVMPDPANGFDLPNAFTPNNDGLNDCFGVKSWGAVSDLRLTIYDRWGHVMFQTTDPSKCWDGNYKGQELTTAVFVYQVSANTICGKIYRKGTVTLIR